MRTAADRGRRRGGGGGAGARVLTAPGPPCRPERRPRRRCCHDRRRPCVAPPHPHGRDQRTRGGIAELAEDDPGHREPESGLYFGSGFTPSLAGTRKTRIRRWAHPRRQETGRDVARNGHPPSRRPRGGTVLVSESGSGRRSERAVRQPGSQPVPALRSGRRPPARPWTTTDRARAPACMSDENNWPPKAFRSHRRPDAGPWRPVLSTKSGPRQAHRRPRLPGDVGPSGTSRRRPGWPKYW